MTDQAEQEIEKINLEIAKRNLKWTAGLNPIAILSDEEKRRLCGLLPPKERLAFTKIEKISLPFSFDWRNYNGNWLTPVKNQGNCGSCWAFSTVGSAEAKFKINTNNPDLNIDLSEQDLVSCCGECGSGCGGGFMNSAFAYIQNNGIVDENCFPYTASNVPCSRCLDYSSRLYKINGFSAFGLSNVRDALFQYGPITCGMSLPNDFFNYNGGIYEPTTKTIVGLHGVVIVGYNNDERYWIIKNSWGTGWGESGYFRMSYNANWLFMINYFFSAKNTFPPGPIGKAYINVNSNLKADVYLYDQLVGTTPLSNYQVDNGGYALILKRDHYENYMQRFPINPGETKTFNITLTPKAIINIKSTPTSASIYLDENFLGTTDSSFEVDSGEHYLTLKKDAYDDYTITKFSINPGETKTFDITLTPKATININSNPSVAEIYLDNSLIGWAPFSFYVSAGTYNVKVAHPGYEPDIFDFTVNSGETKTFNITLTALPPGIEVIDQQCDDNWVTSPQPIGQTFKPSLNNITKIELKLIAETDITGKFKLSVYDSPSKTILLGEKEIDVTLGWHWSNYEFIFPSIIYVIPEQEYYFEIGVSSAFMHTAIGIGDIYPRGEAYGNFDIVFKTYALTGLLGKTIINVNSIPTKANIYLDGSYLGKTNGSWEINT